MQALQRLQIVLTLATLQSQSQQLLPHTLTLPNKSITLSLPAPFTIEVAAIGLHRPRFSAISLDHRIFVTEMHDLSGNQPTPSS